MLYWFIGIILYVLIAFFAYKKYFVKFDTTTFEKIWFSIFWIAVLPLYGVRKIQEQVNKNEES